jgi:hypothetical protein
MASYRMKSAKAAAMPANFGLAPRRGVSLGTSRHETASFAPIASPRSEEASHGALAKIISTNVSIQFLRRLDDRRFDVNGRARVYRPARVRLKSGLDGRVGRLSVPRQNHFLNPGHFSRWSVTGIA